MKLYLNKNDRRSREAIASLSQEVIRKKKTKNQIWLSINKKIIIDTDPGVDDALSIMFAIKSNCNILWLTTIFWNSNIEDTTKNTLKILSILNKSIPVYKWISRPIIVNPIIAKSHWEWWFWGFECKLKNKIEDISAIDFLIQSLETSKSKEISLICQGPTTNIAILSILRPDLLKKIDKCIILWWVVWEKWNKWDFAEFNVLNDPQALKIILNTWMDIYLIPINVCRKVYFNIDDFNLINDSKISKSVKQITEQYINYYKNNLKYWWFSWWVMYDLLATSFFVKPKLFKTKKSFINVITDSSPNIGQTLEDTSKKPNCNLITDVDVNWLKNIFFETMNSKN